VTTGVDLGSVPLSGGSASLTISALAVGTHLIRATYGGDSNFTLSLDSLTQTVSPAAATTVVTPSANPSAFDQSVTFTATIGVVAPGAGTPTGTVTFMDGSTTLGTGSLSSTGTASFTTSTLAVGAHSITAAYGGDGNFTTSTSGTVSQVVSPAVTGLAVASASGTYGGTTTLTATLTAGSVGVPGQTITFTLNGQPCSGNTAVTDSSGVATLQNVSLAGINAGTYSNSIQASFPGDTNYLSSSGTGTLTVNKANQSIQLTVNKANQSIQWSNPADVGLGTALSATQLNATVTGCRAARRPAR